MSDRIVTLKQPENIGVKLASEVLRDSYGHELLTADEVAHNPKPLFGVAGQLSVNLNSLKGLSALSKNWRVSEPPQEFNLVDGVILAEADSTTFSDGGSLSAIWHNAVILRPYGAQKWVYADISTWRTLGGRFTGKDPIAVRFQDSPDTKRRDLLLRSGWPVPIEDYHTLERMAKTDLSTFMSLACVVYGSDRNFSFRNAEEKDWRKPGLILKVGEQHRLYQPNS